MSIERRKNQFCDIFQFIFKTNNQNILMRKKNKKEIENIAKNLFNKNTIFFYHFQEVFFSLNKYFQFLEKGIGRLVLFIFVHMPS